MKKCKNCSTKKEESEFYIADKKMGYLSANCKACHVKLSNERRREKQKIKNNYRVKSLEGEVWKQVNEYEGLYEISNFGRVKSVKRKAKHSISPSGYRTVKEKLLTIGLNNYGYKVVSLTKNNVTKTKYLHRLIACAFIKNEGDKKCINHKDGIKTNNKIDNLEWCTKKENNEHALKTELINNKGELHGFSKLKENEVLNIRELCKNSEYSQREIADMYDISQQHVSAINTKKFWSWL